MCLPVSLHLQGSSSFLLKAMRVEVTCVVLLLAHFGSNECALHFLCPLFKAEIIWKGRERSYGYKSCAALWLLLRPGHPLLALLSPSRWSVARGLGRSSAALITWRYARRSACRVEGHSLTNASLSRIQVYATRCHCEKACMIASKQMYGESCHNVCFPVCSMVYSCLCRVAVAAQSNITGS